MRRCQFADRCFVMILFLATAGFFGVLAYSMVAPEPHQNGLSLFLRIPR